MLVKQLSILAGLVFLAGCAGAPPAGTPAAQAPTRQLQAVADLPDRDTAVANFKQLPARISAADAEKLLVKIDANQVDQNAGNRSLQWIRGFGFGYPYRSYLYGAYSYYPYGSYYYPYSYIGGSYYPYSYGAYSPFFYRRSGLYRPYYFW
jgi:hypothetical protein